MQETQGRGQEDPLNKAMATHSSTLARKIPWTEKPIAYSPWDCKEPDMTERLHFTYFIKCKIKELLTQKTFNILQSYIALRLQTTFC